jgi:CheY-like chemotaxis protein
VPYRPDSDAALQAMLNPVALTAAEPTPLMPNKAEKIHTESRSKQQQHHDSRQQDVPRQSTPDGKKTLRILVVDDSPTILKMTSMMLQKQGDQWVFCYVCNVFYVYDAVLGHTVDTAIHGADALEIVQNTHQLNNNNTDTAPTTPGLFYDVILTDLQMSVMDGMEFVKRLRALEASRRTKDCTAHRQFIIGFSANSDSVTMQEALSSGMDAFISKPFTLRTFNDTCERFLEGK